MSDQRCSDTDQSRRDIPSFIEPRPPLILNPFMRPRPQKGTNLLELFEEDSEIDEPEWVKVYLRMKPYPVKNNLYEVRSDKCLITSTDTATAGHGRRTQHNVSKMYTFSHIFGSDSSQREIFEHVVKGNLKKLPEGQNFTLLTYGASGSGKTYTLMGTVQSPGLVPRSLEYVFKIVDAAQEPLYKPADGGADKLDYYDQDYELQFVKKLRQVSAPLRDKYRRMSAQLRNDLTTSTFDLANRTRYYVWVSFVEIYNESIYDLLSQSDRSKATSKLRIREDSTGNVYVKGATQAFVRSGSEAYDVLVAGKHNLQVAATGVHAASSRSHCIFTITMLTHTDEGVRTSCVRLCDLAGCERVRHTKNTGARMQESRAINSSLHVLERCLHMLRRKQKKIDTTLVPYRESKLTRLLGAGLSGARGEAVSMVVTLTPAPQFQAETRHVLQLAAVAKDIQVNQTIAESTLECTQDTTLEVSAEVMKLRSDNERLHFELVQAHSRNKELVAAMEDKQQEVAATMYEIVEEAKDMTKHYYEAQLHALRAEMEEMQEDYENRLKMADKPDVPPSDSGTPSRSLQKKIAELMTDIAILEEKLTAEKLARARAEDEVQHLRACIEERDEKAEEASVENNEDVMSIVDSESDTEEEDDVYNESLEPKFKKEDINRSRMLQLSLMNDSKVDKTIDNNDTNNDNDTEVNKSNDTLKDDDETQDDTEKESTYLSEESDTTRKSSMVLQNTSIVSLVRAKNTDEQANEVAQEEIAQRNSHQDRGTYVVRDEETNKQNDKTVITQKLSQGFATIDRIRKSMENMEKDLNKDVGKISEQITDKIMNRLFSHTTRSDVSLFQFEQLEKASQSDEPKANKVVETFSNIKILKEKRNFFEDDKDKNGLIPKLNKSKTYFDNIDINIDSHKKLNEIKKLLNEDRSPSIVKEDVTGNFEPSAIKKLLGESFSRQPDVISTVKKVTLPKKQVSVDIFESPQVIITKDIAGTNQPGPNVADQLSVLQETSNNSVQNINTTNDVSHEINKVDIDIVKVNSVKDVSHEINKVNIDIVKVEKSDSPPKPKVSIFEKCIEKVICPKPIEEIEKTRKSVEQMVLKEANDFLNKKDQIKIKEERISVHTENEAPVLKENEPQLESQAYFTNNTVEDFENIYKDITAPRATEFDLLASEVTQNNTTSDISNNLSTNNDQESEKPKYNLRHTKFNTSADKNEIKTRDRSNDKKTVNKDTSLDRKELETGQNQNKKEFGAYKKVVTDKKDGTCGGILLESEAKCESKAKTKRNLRLRRQKNEDYESGSKLKDIVNLQKEFSDVTLDVPVPTKEFKDIESPEKTGEVENLPPLLGIQSCPSKSVLRSRRKLFTPRAEPLEESMAQSGDSSERVRVRVPRPSYHRTTRARRKL